jgi:hypothetical protein
MPDGTNNDEGARSNVSRRNFFKQIGVAGAAAATTGPVPAVAQTPAMATEVSADDRVRIQDVSGKRIITSHVLIERNVFVDALDGLHVLNSDVRASSAAHNSARFSYISPAGNLGRRKDPAGDSKSHQKIEPPHETLIPQDHPEQVPGHPLQQAWTDLQQWLAAWNGSVIDGGYFENYGTLTALELARAAEAT